MDILTVIGAAAACASMASFAPQAWKIITSRNTEDLSAPMYALTVAAFGLWLSYGALQGDWALIVPNLVCLILSGFILLMILVPRRTRDEIADTIEEAAPAAVTDRETAS